MSDHAFSATIRGKIIIPESVTIIGNGAFLGCTELMSITIPASVTSIGYSAFMFSGLTDIYFTGTEEEWDAIAGLNYVAIPEIATIHYNYQP